MSLNIWPAKIEEYPSDIPQVSKLRVLRKKYLKDDKHVQRPPFGVETCSDISPWTLSAPQSLQFSYALSWLSDTVSFSEQTMSADKYPRIFLAKRRVSVMYMNPKKFKREVLYSNRAHLQANMRKKYHLIFT